MFPLLVGSLCPMLFLVSNNELQKQNATPSSIIDVYWPCPLNLRYYSIIPAEISSSVM